jgi:hypothetical protein
VGVDRDQDGAFDGDELDGGTDPGDERSVPTSAILCGGSATIQSPRISITRNGEPAGDEVLTIRGEWTLPGASPAIDPIAHGVRVRLDDSLGQPLFNRVVGRGEPIARGYPGWRVNRSGTRWTFRDRRGESSGGVVSVTVEDRSRVSPGLFRVTVRGKASNFRVPVAALPLRMTVVLGGPEQAALGQCATRVFNPPGGTAPTCRASADGSAITCS